MIKSKDLLYLRVAESLEKQIRKGTYGSGEKMPGLRVLCAERGISLGTATSAYLELESRSLIASRPRSGYYVTWTAQPANELPSATKPLLTSRSEDTRRIIDAVLSNAPKAKIFLSSGVLALELLPLARLNKAMVRAMRELPGSGVNYERHGNHKLKEQIARRSHLWNGSLSADDVITTAGCMDALAFSLQSVTRPGDAIGVESPLYFGILQLAQNIGRRVVELPMHPVTGVDPAAVENAMKNKQISACVLVSNFSNPLGSCMPAENKKAIAVMAEKYNVPVIEDDLYGDLYFGKQRPLTIKTFDEAGMVLYCGSFSKTLAAGYRVGWVAPGRFFKSVSRTKNYHSIACNSLAHAAVADFLENGRYEQHLRSLRLNLYRNNLQLQRCIAAYFPEDSRLSRPQGGFHSWLELGKKFDAIDLYNQAIAQRISFSPGRLYTLRDQYNHCMRLSSGFYWNAKHEQALKTLGFLAKKLKSR